MISTAIQFAACRPRFALAPPGLAAQTVGSGLGGPCVRMVLLGRSEPPPQLDEWPGADSQAPQVERGAEVNAPSCYAGKGKGRLTVKVVVIGGTGLIGSKVVTDLNERGHEAVPASPRLGINTITGEGLAA